MNLELRKGEVCPKCKRTMERRNHTGNETAIFRKPFYYEFWDYCSPCRHVQHYDKFKVVNSIETRIKFGA